MSWDFGATISEINIYLRPNLFIPRRVPRNTRPAPGYPESQPANVLDVDSISGRLLRIFRRNFLAGHERVPVRFAELFGSKPQNCLPRCDTKLPTNPDICVSTVTPAY